MNEGEIMVEEIAGRLEKIGKNETAMKMAEMIKRKWMKQMGKRLMRIVRFQSLLWCFRFQMIHGLVKWVQKLLLVALKV